MTHSPWKVRVILFIGLLFVASTLLAPTTWMVGLLLLVAATFFVWGFRVAVYDPYELKELDILQEKFAGVNPASTLICPHCGDEYSAKRSVCPSCLRSP